MKDGKFTVISEELLKPAQEGITHYYHVKLNKLVKMRFELLNDVFDITHSNHSVVMWACTKQCMYESPLATIVRPMMFHEVLALLQEMSADSEFFTLTKAEYDAYVHVAMKYNDAE